jgi:putative membrane protein
MMKTLTIGGLALGLSAGAAMAQSTLTPSKEAITPADQTFVTKAAQGGLAEVELGKLAEQNAGSPRVKAFGERMVRDHGQANQQLQEIAQKQGIQIPAQLDPKDQALEERLRGLKGKAFDTAYLRDMVQDHRQDIMDFQKEANTGEDPTVKSFAEKTLPILRQHLSMAQTATK